MKKIFRILFVILTAGALLTSCEEIETGFDAITKDVDPAAGYYLTFTKNLQSFTTGVTETGGLIEVVKPVSVVLMGLPQSAPITVNLTVDPASTMTPAMYTLSSTSITIPAGGSSGSVTVSTEAASMPVDVPLKLILTFNAGEHNPPSATATKLTYTFKRFPYCPLTNGIADLVGTWTGSDAYYGTGFTAAVEGTKLKISGMGEAFMADWWGEPVVSGGSFLMTVNTNGTVDIPRQYIFTTIWAGDNYDYEVMGTGKWENCGASPKLTITYDIYYPGDADGLAKQYASYLDNIPYLTAVVTLGSKGEIEVVQQNLTNIVKPGFKH
ncbi:MAG: DUF1735 domain-containing protein [Bacteroidales bacterium]